jgi:hypothetical protein
MDLNTLFNTVSRVINDRTGPSPDVDTGGFLSEVTGLFRQHADATGQQVDYAQPDILPASMDPLGDPADQYGGQNILPASADPLGDPADQEQGILPASQDPHGDPADQR